MRESFGVIALLLGSLGLGCGDHEQRTTRQVTPLDVGPRMTCNESGETTPIDLEVVPGLLLSGVSGLPPDSAYTPQFVLTFHCRRIGPVDEDLTIEFFVTASGSAGQILAGYANLTSFYPQPRHWKLDSCFPLPCDVALPLSKNPALWRLECRVRRAVGNAEVIRLKDLWLLAGATARS
ncbi:hypothetical protein JXA88_17715 [Candidatus Fermentibacteria bacterium]|nr:hypothetical protein [Candidatus Fermentibacteria bacterium]